MCIARFYAGSKRTNSTLSVNARSCRRCRNTGSPHGDSRARWRVWLWGGRGRNQAVDSAGKRGYARGASSALRRVLPHTFAALDRRYRRVHYGAYAARSGALAANGDGSMGQAVRSDGRAGYYRRHALQRVADRSPTAPALARLARWRRGRNRPRFRVRLQLRARADLAVATRTRLRLVGAAPA